MGLSMTRKKGGDMSRDMNSCGSSSSRGRSKSRSRGIRHIKQGRGGRDGHEAEIKSQAMPSHQ